MSTARTNSYPGTCDTCRADVPAGAGEIYKRYPFTKAMPWLVRCGDVDGCKARAKAAQEAANAAAHDRREAELARLAERAAAVKAENPNAMLSDAELHAVTTMKNRSTTAQIAKTLTFALEDGWSLTISRRRLPNGSFRITTKHDGPDGESHKDTPFSDSATEAEAIGRTLRHLHGMLRFWKNKSESPAAAAMAAFVAEHKGTF